jgi:hypothetical protein
MKYYNTLATVRDVGWMMNCVGFGRKWSWPFWCTVPAFPGGTEEHHERTTVVLTEHVPNAPPDRYRDIKLLPVPPLQFAEPGAQSEFHSLHSKEPSLLLLFLPFAAFWCEPIPMQGNARCAGGQRLALSLHAAHERRAEVGLPGGKLCTGRVVLQSGRVRQHCHLGWAIGITLLKIFASYFSNLSGHHDFLVFCLAYFPYFEQNKIGLWDHVAVCVSVYPLH